MVEVLRARATDTPDCGMIGVVCEVQFGLRSLGPLGIERAQHRQTLRPTVDANSGTLAVQGHVGGDSSPLGSTLVQLPLAIASTYSCATARPQPTLITGFVLISTLFRFEGGQN